MPQGAAACGTKTFIHFRRFFPYEEQRQMTRSLAAVDPWSYYAYTVKSARSEAAFKQRKLQLFLPGFFRWHVFVKKNKKNAALPSPLRPRW